MNLPTVRQLRYMVALDEHQHFGQAANACFVSQSAFSMAIKELESVLDVKVVDRTSKSISITPEGKIVAARARRWLQEMTELVEDMEKTQGPLTGKLNLGVIPSIAPFLLPQILPGIREKFPDLRLYLRERLTEMLYEDLMAGEVDVILIAFPYELRHTDTMSLFQDGFLLACREDTAWLDPNNYSLNSLKADSVLLLEDGHCLREHTLAACQLRGTEIVSRYAASSLFTLLNMVDGDMGVTFIPEMARESLLLKQTRIHLYPLEEDSYREIGLVWRKNSVRAEEFILLGETIRDLHKTLIESVAEVAAK